MNFNIQRFADTDFLKDNLKGFVPQEVSNDIIQGVLRGSSILKLSNVQPMTSDSKKYSVFKNGVGAYWVNEAGRIGTSVPNWDSPVLTAQKLGVIIPVTNEKLNDSVISVFDEVRPMISEAFYKAIDAACLFGINSPFTKSVYSEAVANSMVVSLGTNTKLDLDVSDVMALIEAKGYEAGGFISNIAFKNSLRKLRDANGNQLYVQGLTNENGLKYDTLYSLPIEFCRNGAWDATKAVCICGNWKDYAMVGLREDIQYEILKEATLTTITMDDGAPLSLAERDMVAIRATMRIGFLPVKGDAFALLTPAGGSSSGSGSTGSDTGSGTSTTNP